MEHSLTSGCFQEAKLNLPLSGNQSWKATVASVPLAAGEVCIDVTTGHTCFAAIRFFSGKAISQLAVQFTGAGSVCTTLASFGNLETIGDPRTSRHRLKINHSDSKGWRYCYIGVW